MLYAFKITVMRTLILNRMQEMKKQNGSYFSKRTYFGEVINEIDITKLEDEKLIGLFEQMTRLHYTQR